VAFGAHNHFISTKSAATRGGIILVIDMKEGTIKYQFPLKKGMNHFPRKKKKLLLTLFLEQIIILMLHRLKLLDFHFLRLAQRP
jgi:hypothetical protein